MRFTFKPASLERGVGTLTVAPDGESALALRPPGAAAAGDPERNFIGHMAKPTHPRFFLIRQTEAQGGGYVLRRVHEVCQLALSGSDGPRRRRAPAPAAAAAAAAAVSDAVGTSPRPRKRARHNMETAPVVEEEKAHNIDGSCSSSSSSDDSSDDSMVDALEADLLG
jgi:hypothetical protein